MRFFQLNLFGQAQPPQRLHWNSTRAELRARWDDIAAQYFPGNERLADYLVVWSERVQRRVLGSCNMTTQRVRISRAMDRPELEELLDALLYHEMCHAVVGMYRSQTSGRRVYHGPEFRELERRHPAMRNLDQWIKSGGWSRAVRSYSAHLGARSRVKSVTVYKK